MRNSILATIAALLSSTLALAQVSGKITNSKGEPVPFVSIYIKEQMQGTTSNEKGQYLLRVKPGTYTITFQAIGYKTTTKKVDASKETKQDIILADAVYQFQEFVVSSKDNPAERIIRKVIANGQLYKSKLGGYSSEVYFKGNLLVSKLSRLVKLLAPRDAKLPVAGKTYTIEMANQVNFKAPNSFTQRTLSMRSNFPDSEFEIPKIGLFQGSIYNDKYYGVVSPLGIQGLSCYKFHLIGSSENGGITTYKIGVAPRSSSGEYFKGFLYIQDNTYAITSADLSVKTSIANSTITIAFEMVNNLTPLPTGIKIKQQIDVMGNNAAFTILSTVKYNRIEAKNLATPNQTNKVATAEKRRTPRAAKNKKKIDEITSKIESIKEKENITIREMRQMAKLTEEKEELEDTLKTLEISDIKVVKDSLFNMQDSVYWGSIRPIPLTAEELRFNHETDSITALIPKGAAVKKDSSQLKTKWNLVAPLLGGNLYQKGEARIRASGLISTKGSYFNPVDGYTLATNLGLSTSIDSSRKLTANLMPMYSFERQKFMGKADLTLHFSPRKPASIGIMASYYTEDFSKASQLSRFANSISCLEFKSNLQKVIEVKEVGARYEMELFNGFTASVGANILERTLVENRTNHSWFRQSWKYNSNLPVNIYTDAFPLDSYKLSEAKLVLTYIPSPKYRFTAQGRKVTYTGNKPAFTLSAEQALNILNSRSTHTHLELGVKQVLDLSFSSKLHYSIKAGTFLNSSKMQLSDFYFPQTQYIPFSTNGSKTTFYLLPYYKYATPKTYAESHLCLESERILLKFIPLLANKGMTENIHLGYYSTSRYKNYMEVGYALDKLFLVGGVTITASFENGKYDSWGIKGYISL